MDLEGKAYCYEAGNWKQEIHNVFWNCARKSKDEGEG
jgi:hypothetical protein